MNVSRETIGGLGDHAGHIPYITGSVLPVSLAVREPEESDPLAGLGNALFPYSLYQYPGRMTAMALVLGISRSSYASLAKPSGAKRLGLRLVSAAAKICEAKIAELSAILADLRAREKALQAKAGRPKGFMVVKVRDKSGIPRDARWRGKNNEPGF